MSKKFPKIRKSYQGKWIAKVIDFDKILDPDGQLELVVGRKCSCGHAMGHVWLRLRLRGGETKDFCNHCRDDIINGRETPEEKWDKIRAEEIRKLEDEVLRLGKEWDKIMYDQGT